MSGDGPEDDLPSVADLYRAGASVRQICAATGLGYGTVRYILRREGIPMRGRGGYQPRRSSGPAVTARQLLDRRAQLLAHLAGLMRARIDDVRRVEEAYWRDRH